MQKHVRISNLECSSHVKAGSKSLLACALLTLLSASNAMAAVETDNVEVDATGSMVLVTSTAPGSSNEIALDAGQSEIRVRSASGSASGATTIGAGDGTFSGSLTADSVSATSISATDISVGGNQVVTSNQLAAMQNSNAAFADQVDTRFDAMDRRIDQVEERAYAGIASVAALAAIPAPAHGKRFSIGAGLGNYSSESAVAVGFRAAITESTSVTAGVSRNTASKTAANLGVGYSW